MATTPTTGSSSLTFDAFESFTRAVGDIETQIADAVTGGADGQLDTGELLQLQQLTAEFQIFTNATSTVLQTIRQALSGVLQRVN